MTDPEGVRPTDSPFIDDTELPCSYCGRLKTCEPCEHCSYSAVIADCLSTILGDTNRNTGELLAAARTLAKSGDWHSSTDGVVAARVRWRLRSKVGADAVAALFDQPETHGRPVFVKAADLRPEPVTWLWADRVPVSEVVLLHGDPGSGKSLTAADMAARVSRGRAFPGSPSRRDPADVAWIGHAGEDTLANVASALIAADADMDRVHLFDPADGGALAQALERARALSPAGGGRQCGAWLADDGKTTNDAEAVRAMLSSAAGLRGDGAAVVVIAHDRKDRESPSEAHLAAGSGQLMGGVRAALHVDGGMLTVSKSNLGARPSGVPFEVLPAEVNGRGFVRWLEPDQPPVGGGGGLDVPTVDPGGVVGDVSAWVMAEFESTGDGVTMNQIREGLSMKGVKQRDRLRAVLDTSVREGRLETVTVTRRGVPRTGYQPALSPSSVYTGLHRSTPVDRCRPVFRLLGGGEERT